MEKFQHKYRIPSARLKTWDYGTNGLYFITICTQHRECYFGDIVETRFIASQIGELAQKYWYEIPEHFPFVKLDAFVVMPNHVHGIIIIDKPDGNGRDDNGCDGNGCDVDGCNERRDGCNCRDAINRVSTNPEPQSPLQPNPEPQSPSHS